MRVILDSNIWITFLIGHRLQENRAILTNPNVDVYYCTQLVEEILDVTGRSKIRRYVDNNEIEDLVRLIRAFGHSAAIGRDAISAIRDPKDLYLLSLAETVAANYIISGDADLLVLGQHKSTLIIRLADFTASLPQ